MQRSCDTWIGCMWPSGKLQNAEPRRRNEVLPEQRVEVGSEACRVWMILAVAVPDGNLSFSLMMVCVRRGTAQKTPMKASAKDHNMSWPAEKTICGSSNEKAGITPTNPVASTAFNPLSIRSCNRSALPVSICPPVQHGCSSLKSLHVGDTNAGSDLS